MPDETHHIRFQLTRTPVHGLDPTDAEGARGYMLRVAEGSLLLGGRLESAVVYLGAGMMERGSLAAVEELGKEPMVALLFRTASDRAFVVRAFREGEVILDIGESKRRAAGVLELERGTERWWLAWRLFGQGEAGVGVFHGDWQRSEGEGLDALPEPFREWIDTAKVELESHGVSETGPGPVEDIRMAVAGVAGVLPDHPCQVAVALGRISDADRPRPSRPSWG